MRFASSVALGGPSGIDWPRWLWISLGLHGLALTALSVTQWQAATPLSPEMLTRIRASAQRAQHVQMQRKLEALEQIQRELASDGSSKPPSPEQVAAEDAALSRDPKLMLERAKAIAARIERRDQEQRALDLARKTGQPLAKAIEQVQHADAARAASAPRPSGDANRQMSELAAHARQTLASQRQHAELGGATQGPPGHGVGKGHADPLANGAPLAHGDASGTSRTVVYAPGAWNSPLLEDSAFLDLRDYGPMMPTPALDAAHLALGAGRTIGAGGVLANRVFLDSWYIIGPFAGYGARSVEVVYEPERGVDLDAAYVGKNGMPLEWRYVAGNVYPLVPPQRAENAVFYAYTQIRVDHDMNVWFNVGADDDSKMWVNDDLVWSSNQGDKPWYHRPFYALSDEIAQYNLVEGRVRVHLHQGANRVLFKLYNGIDLTFLAVVVTP